MLSLNTIISSPIFTSEPSDQLLENGKFFTIGSDHKLLPDVSNLFNSKMSMMSQKHNDVPIFVINIKVCAASRKSSRTICILGCIFKALWSDKREPKSPTTFLSFWLETDMYRIFQTISYQRLILIKAFQSYMTLMLAIKKDIVASAKLVEKSV